jgi:F-type H+-transporting ATPase subunit gamma
MANLKEIRTRITSVSSTMQITSAMKMVSAAKLKRAQDAITRMRPYANKMQEILGNLSSSLEGDEGVFTRQRTVNKVLIVAITSNRGLCGAFNNNVIKEVRNLMAGEFAGKQVSILSLGKKAHDFYKKTKNHYSDGFGETPYMVFDGLTYERSSAVCEEIMKRYAAGEWDRVVMVYNRFKNAASQVTTTEQILPVVAPTDGGKPKGEYIFEPTKEEIVTELIPKSLKVTLFKALLDSHASEHGARMTAMHKATDNAGELRRELRIYYNKARQAAITNEILEIVGGAEALNG